MLGVSRDKKTDNGNGVGIAALLTAAVFMLSSCAPRDAAQNGVPHPDATTERIYVVTQRALDRTGPVFGEQRLNTLNHFRADISIPPTHEVGQIEWARGKANAATDFVVTDTDVFDDSTEMMRDIRGHRDHSETLVFVHGYNNTLSDAMYRLAQIKTDFESPDPALLFSWQSAGDARGYVYDRDSVLFARDDLMNTLKNLTNGPKETVFIVAHSMGATLAMEALRQAALSGDKHLLSRIGGVVLMSPDIDPDLFRKQAEAIGKLPDPFLIFVSQSDRALGFAGFLTGRKPRLGGIDNPDQVEGLDVTVLDFTALDDGVGLHHAVPVTSPAAVTLLRGMIAQQAATGEGFDRHVVLEE